MMSIKSRQLARAEVGANFGALAPPRTAQSFASGSEYTERLDPIRETLRATCKTLGHGAFIPGVRYEGSGWSNVTRTIGRIDGSTCRMATVGEPICRERGPLRSHSWPGAGMRARLSVPPSREAYSGMTGTEPKVRFKSEGAPIGLPSAPGCRTSRGNRLWHRRKHRIGDCTSADLTMMSIKSRQLGRAPRSAPTSALLRRPEPLRVLQAARSIQSGWTPFEKPS